MSNIYFEPEPGQKSAMQDLAPPIPFLYAALGLVALVFTMAISARFFGLFKFDSAPYAAVESTWLRFVDAEDGSILVFDAQGAADKPMIRIAPQTNQFLRGALRGLARKRRAANVQPEQPFVLTKWADGRITLDDPSTKAQISIESFGPTQVESFVALLPSTRAAAMGLPPEALGVGQGLPDGRPAPAPVP
jgi:putative photosynthetic complex assembly protein